MNSTKQHSDSILIINVKEKNCEDSFRELVARHENLYYKVCHGYATGLKKVGVSLEEILNDKMFVFFSSVSSFDAEKNVKFSTWLANQARFNCLNKISSTKNKLFVDNEEISPIIDSEISMEAFRQRQMKINLDNVLTAFNELSDNRVSYVFKRKYSDYKVKWKNIAEELGVTTQTVLNLHKKGLSLLKRKIRNKKLEIYE
jgi:RNA polymerase sigma factor (sigma-70 family)